MIAPLVGRLVAGAMIGDAIKDSLDSNKITPVLPANDASQMSQTPNSSVAPDKPISENNFFDKLKTDNAFKKTLLNVGFMKDVLEEIKARQIQTIDIIEDNNENLEEKVDKLQKTLDDIVKTDRIDKEEAEKERREREQEGGGDKVSDNSLGSIIQPENKIKNLGAIAGLGLFAAYEVYKYGDVIVNQFDEVMTNLVGYVNKKVNDTLKYFGIDYRVPEYQGDQRSSGYQKPRTTNFSAPASSYNGPKPTSTQSNYEKSTRFVEPKSKDRTISDRVMNVHKKVSENTGVPLEDLVAVGSIESSNNPDDVTGSYRGIYQLRKQTNVDVTSDSYQVNKMSDNIKGYRERFKKYMGRYPDVAEWYIMHQQGPTGGLAICLAYYNKDYNISAAEGCVKYSKQILKINLTVALIVRNITSNWYFVSSRVPQHRTPSTVTVKEYYEAFIQHVYDVRDAAVKKATPPSDTSLPKPNTTAKLATGTTTAPEGTFTGQAGSRQVVNGVTHDKSGGENDPGLDVIVDKLKKEGFIPQGSVISYNDKHHQKKSEQNKHRRGIAIDISVPGANSAERAKLMKRVEEIGREYGINIIAEDHTGKSGSTGQHVHLYFENENEADKFMVAYNRKNQTKLASATPVPNNPSTGKILVESGSAEKPKVVVVPTPTQQKQQRQSPPPQSKPGTSGVPPSAFNFDVPGFLHHIT